MYTSTDDTIVAISSAPGGAARGIVRLSGPHALALAARLTRLPGANLSAAPGFTVHAGVLLLDDARTLPADIYVFRAPRSYTRQDLIELHTVGSPPLLDLIVERCLTLGARLALPGEFTARAFLAGAVSLPEAESVAATIAARNDAQLRSARRLRDRHLTEQICHWQSELADLRALVEADIDFAEEPIDFITPDEFTRRVRALLTRLTGLLDTARDQERFDALPRVLLLGLPNAGKSTLLNRLAGIDRAIASAVAGTTRDLLTAPARFGEVETLLIDSAGIGDSADDIAAAGGRRALAAAAHADVVCLVFDGADPPTRREVHPLLVATAACRLIVANKQDLVAASAQSTITVQWHAAYGAAPLWISALTGEGVPELRSAIAERLHSDHRADDFGIALSTHQRMVLQEAAEALARALDTAASAAETLDVAELLAVDLREAQDALAAFTGAVTTEDLLSRIFSAFCIGK